jgi:hypothetical protein
MTVPILRKLKDTNVFLVSVYPQKILPRACLSTVFPTNVMEVAGQWALRTLAVRRFRKK